MKRQFLFLVIIALILAAGVAIAGTGSTTIDDKVRSSVEKSTLPKKEKALILVKSYEAIKAGIPPDDLAVIINRGLKNKTTDGKTMEKFIDIAIKVKAQNLPVRPILDMIQQGLSKQVPAARIFNVTNRLAKKLARANIIVGNLV